MDKRLVDVVRVLRARRSAEPPRGRLAHAKSAETTSTTQWKARAMAAGDSTAIAICPPGEDAARLWRIRADRPVWADAVEIDEDGNVVGNNRWPGWEDAAVRPKI